MGFFGIEVLGLRDVLWGFDSKFQIYGPKGFCRFRGWALVLVERDCLSMEDVGFRIAGFTNEGF